MGCIPRTQKVKVNSPSFFYSPKQPVQQKEKKSTTIARSSWVNIIDYLNYSEVKEIGKTSRAFNRIAKQDIILIKFFKRRATEWKSYPLIQREATNTSVTTPCSFAILQKMHRLESVDSLYLTDNEINPI